MNLKRIQEGNYFLSKAKLLKQAFDELSFVKKISVGIGSLAVVSLLIGGIVKSKSSQKPGMSSFENSKQFGNSNFVDPKFLNDTQIIQEEGVSIYYPKDIALLDRYMKETMRSQKTALQKLKEIQKEVSDWNKEHLLPQNQIKSIRVDFGFNSFQDSSSEKGAMPLPEVDLVYKVGPDSFSSAPIPLMKNMSNYFKTTANQAVVTKYFKKISKINEVTYPPSKFLNGMHSGFYDRMNPRVFYGDEEMNALNFYPQDQLVHSVDIGELKNLMKEVMFESWVPKALIDVTVEKMPQMFGGSSFEEQITFQRVQLKNFKYIHPAVNAPSFGGDVFTFVDSKSFRKFLEKIKMLEHPYVKGMILMGRKIWGSDFDLMTQNAFKDLYVNDSFPFPKLSLKQMADLLFDQDGYIQLRAIRFLSAFPEFVTTAQQAEKMIEIYGIYSKELSVSEKVNPANKNFSASELNHRLTSQAQEWFMPIANIIERSKLPEAQKKIYFEKLKKTGIEPQIMTRQNNTQTQFNVPQGISQEEMHKKMKEHSEKVFEQHRRNTSRPR